MSTSITNLLAKAREAEQRAHWYKTGEEKLFGALADALEAVTADRDRFVLLWKLAANSVMRLQAELEDVTDERDDPNNWPDGAPWLKEAVIGPTESEREKLDGVISAERAKAAGQSPCSWSDWSSESQDEMEGLSDAIIKAGFRLPVPVEPEHDQRLSKIAELLGSLDMEGTLTAPGTAWGSTLRECLALAQVDPQPHETEKGEN